VLVVVVALPLQYQWLSMVYVLCFCGTVAVFVSHTVAAIILMPIVFQVSSAVLLSSLCCRFITSVVQVGVALKVPEVVVIGSAWAISAAMALPFSSFPNVNSLLIVDDFQKSYLQVQDFVRCGLPMTIFSIALIATLGFVVIAII
jgi:phosphate transporter